MNAFKTVYDRVLGRKFLNKILITYIVVVIVALLLLSFALSRSVTSKLQEEYSNYNRQAIYSLQEYMQGKIDSVNSIVSWIYDDNDTYDMVFGLLESPDDRSFITSHEAALTLNLKELSYFDDDIQSIIIYKQSSGMSYLYQNSDQSLNNYPDITKRFYQLKYYLQGKKFVSRYPGAYLYNDGSHSFCIINNLIDPSTSKANGKIMIGFDFAAIKAIYSDFNTYVKGQIMILTDDGTVIFDSSEEYYNKVYPYFDTIRNAAGFLELNEPSFVDVTKFGEYGVYFVSVIPQTEFTKNIASLRITMYAISILFIIIIVVLYYLSTRKFARRVNAVVDVINKVGDNNLTQRIPVKGEDDEIALISRIFNKMCDNLQDYIEKVYITEIKQKRMELKALQAQVNPHFLYNTLESIRMGMHKEGNEESADMIYHLAELFRISLKSDSVVTLKDELAYCMTYLKLFSIRYGEKLGFSFDIPDNICEYGIIKHLLQPLIENFIVHGFSWDKDMNHIAIKARADGLNIHIIISDNGSGIHEDRLEEIRLELGSFQATTSDSIGLKNVNDRIKLVFGKQYGLNVSSIHGHGTEVTLTIPQKTKDELKKIIQAS